MKGPRISMGRGKMMVEFFSADILVRVCRYLKQKNPKSFKFEA